MLVFNRDSGVVMDFKQRRTKVVAGSVSKVTPRAGKLAWQRRVEQQRREQLERQRREQQKKGKGTTGEADAPVARARPENR